MRFFDSDFLSTYLQDHLGGATFGLELARRARDENEGTPLGDFLATLATEIEEDREMLLGIMARLGVSPDRLKVAAGWAGEKVGRLKPNGRLLSYSPLSRVTELEGLIAGVNGKHALWRGLRELADHDTRLDAGELNGLIVRAERQIEGLREHHRLVVEDTLAVSG